jgi:hypothetical protein
MFSALPPRLCETGIGNIAIGVQFGDIGKALGTSLKYLMNKTFAAARPGSASGIHQTDITAVYSQRDAGDCKRTPQATPRHHTEQGTVCLGWPGAVDTLRGSPPPFTASVPRSALPRDSLDY